MPRGLAWHTSSSSVPGVPVSEGRVYSVCLKTRLLLLGNGSGGLRALLVPYTDSHITPLSSAATCRMQGTENHGLRKTATRRGPGGWAGGVGVLDLLLVWQRRGVVNWLFQDT